jgi:hypothetical protein
MRFGPLAVSSLRFDPFGGVSFVVRSVGGVIFCGSILSEACLLRFGPLGASSFAVGSIGGTVFSVGSIGGVVFFGWIHWGHCLCGWIHWGRGLFWLDPLGALSVRFDPGGCTTLPRKSGQRNVSVAMPGRIDRLVLSSVKDNPMSRKF